MPVIGARVGIGMSTEYRGYDIGKMELANCRCCGQHACSGKNVHAPRLHVIVKGRDVNDRNMNMLFMGVCACVWPPLPRRNLTAENLSIRNHIFDARIL